MNATATFSSKFQISISKAVRDAHGWKAGQQFAYISKSKGVLLMPVPHRDQLTGIAEGANPEGFRDRIDRY